MYENGRIPFLKNFSKAKILAIAKGKRPDPFVYLPKEYITTHLKKFDDEIVRVLSKNAFLKHGILGPKEAFVLPKSYFDDVIKKSNGDIKLLEEALGFEKGYLRSDDVMIVLIKRQDVRFLNIPSGNEAGANPLWLPGGYTSGKTPEAVMDLSIKVRFEEIKLK